MYKVLCEILLMIGFVVTTWSARGSICMHDYASTLADDCGVVVTIVTGNYRLLKGVFIYLPIVSIDTKCT